MKRDSESQWEFPKNLGELGIPALIAAYIYQPWVAGFDTSQRHLSFLILFVAFIFARWVQANQKSRWSVIGSFGFGIVIALVILFFPPGKLSSEYANNIRCIALQEDMLSARPRRSDSRELFVALGCHPQGEGSVFAPPLANSRE